MQKTILAALFTGVLALAGAGCSDEPGDEGSLSESALKGGRFADGGQCKCGKDDAGKPGNGKGKPDSDAGRGKPDKAESDAGKGKSGEDHGKPEKAESDAGKGKSGEDHGKPEDEDAQEEEDTLDEDALLPLKKVLDGGAKKGKPSRDCTC